MSDHYARTKDEAPPEAMTPRQRDRAQLVERYRALVAQGLDRDALRARLGLSVDQLKSLAKATGTTTPKADRGPGECREARAPGGWEWCGRGKVKEESK
jgi:hypothetical protein